MLDQLTSKLLIHVLKDATEQQLIRARIFVKHFNAAETVKASMQDAINAISKEDLSMTITDLLQDKDFLTFFDSRITEKIKEAVDSSIQGLQDSITELKDSMPTKPIEGEGTETAGNATATDTPDESESEVIAPPVVENENNADKAVCSALIDHITDLVVQLKDASIDLENVVDSMSNYKATLKDKSKEDLETLLKDKKSEVAKLYHVPLKPVTRIDNVENGVVVAHDDIKTPLDVFRLRIKNLKKKE